MLKIIAALAATSTYRNRLIFILNHSHLGCTANRIIATKNGPELLDTQDSINYCEDFMISERASIQATIAETNTVIRLQNRIAQLEAEKKESDRQNQESEAKRKEAERKLQEFETEKSKLERQRAGCADVKKMNAFEIFHTAHGVFSFTFARVPEAFNYLSKTSLKTNKYFRLMRMHTIPISYGTAIVFSCGTIAKILFTEIEDDKAIGKQHR